VVPAATTAQATPAKEVTDEEASVQDVTTPEPASTGALEPAAVEAQDVDDAAAVKANARKRAEEAIVAAARETPEQPPRKS